MHGMREREIEVPRFLHEIHGERASPFAVALVYVTGVVFGVLALAFAWSRVAELPWWKSLLLFLVAADVSGGAVANFSRGTDAYYGGRPLLRWGFIFVHAAWPAVLFLFFDGRLAYWVFLYVYTVAAASVVNVIPQRERQEVAAAALLALGIVILLPLGLDVPFLAWFPPVFMTKIILAFAVRRS